MKSFESRTFEEQEEKNQEDFEISEKVKSRGIGGIKDEKDFTLIGERETKRLK